MEGMKLYKVILSGVVSDDGTVSKFVYATDKDIVLDYYSYVISNECTHKVHVQEVDTINLFDKNEEIFNLSRKLYTARQTMRDYLQAFNGYVDGIKAIDPSYPVSKLKLVKEDGENLSQHSDYKTMA